MLNPSINIENGIRELSKPLWINKLKEWISQEIEPWTIERFLTKKGRRGGVGWDFSKVNQEKIILSICYRSQFNYFTKPKIFLVNPSEFLVKKWQLDGPNEQGSHIYSVEIETNDSFQKAKNLLTEFIKEKQISK